MSEFILRDVNVLLESVASKSSRLINNVTTNLAESCMNVRLKFDGGKVINICQRGSWHIRCYGASIRSDFGPQWAPIVLGQVCTSTPGRFFCETYKKRQNARNSNKKIQDKQESKQKRWKRKYGNKTVTNTKKAKLSYGSQVVEHYTANELDVIKTNFLAQNVIVSLEKIKQI